MPSINQTPIRENTSPPPHSESQCSDASTQGPSQVQAKGLGQNICRGRTAGGQNRGVTCAYAAVNLELCWRVKAQGQQCELQRQNLRAPLWHLPRSKAQPPQCAFPFQSQKISCVRPAEGLNGSPPDSTRCCPQPSFSFFSSCRSQYGGLQTTFSHVLSRPCEEDIHYGFNSLF